MRGYNAGYDACSNERERSNEQSQSTSRNDEMDSVYRFTVIVMSDASSEVDIGSFSAQKIFLYIYNLQFKIDKLPLHFQLLKFKVVDAQLERGKPNL
jgi:hypothetical protein